ncbi:MAG: dihydropteroate synthase [Candidatus Delongbacteria bacterium]|nr:dihydropteroate synthase [Candidatus Delongbacteria bacterium]
MTERFPLIMGIINITPDSFFAGSRHEAPDSIIESIERMIEAGADLIDLGAESTRPYAEMITAEQEIGRLLPVIERIRQRFPGLVLSVDTYKSETAEACLKAGVPIINDVSGFDWDQALLEILVRYRPGYILMHSLGRPESMQDNPCYQNVVEEIMNFWKSRSEILIRHGIPTSSIMVDPGIGFGKRCSHNLDILRQLSRLKRSGFKLVIGLSRKRFLGELLDLKNPADRLNGTTVMHTWCLLQGVDILRVHDVREAVESKRLVAQLRVRKEEA